MNLDPTNPYHLIAGISSTNPGAVVTLPVFAPADPLSTLVLSAKTRLRRLPPELAAQIARDMAAESSGADGNGHGSRSQDTDTPTHMEVGRVLLTLPADIVRNLAGPVSERHPTYLFIVRREAYDEVMQRATSRIVLAGPRDMPNGGMRIVKP